MSAGRELPVAFLALGSGVLSSVQMLLISQKMPSQGLNEKLGIYS
jgi:hypothetical protein